MILTYRQEKQIEALERTINEARIIRSISSTRGYVVYTVIGKNSDVLINSIVACMEDLESGNENKAKTIMY